MKVIVRPRQTGKTTELIKYARDNNYCIICGSYRFVEVVKRISKGLGIEVDVYSAKDPNLYQNIRRNNYRGTVVDDADLVIAELIGWRPYALTVSGIANEEYDEIKHEEERLKNIESMEKYLWTVRKTLNVGENESLIERAKELIELEKYVEPNKRTRY